MELSQCSDDSKAILRLCQEVVMIRQQHPGVDFGTRLVGNAQQQVLELDHALQGAADDRGVIETRGGKQVVLYVVMTPVRRAMPWAMAPLS